MADTNQHDAPDSPQDEPAVSEPSAGEQQAVDDEVVDIALPAGRCRTCGYHLDGLAAGLCPQCGNPFDPQNPTTYDASPALGVFGAVCPPFDQRLPAWALAALALGPVWLGFYTLGLFTWLLVPIILLLLVRRRFAALGLVLLASPATVFFVMGCVDYFRGQAVLWSQGMTDFEFHSLDPATRCERRSSGLLRNDTEWLSHGPNNAAVRLLSGWFGPQQASYTGPYPTRDEAIAALEANGTTTFLADLEKDQVIVGSTTIRLGSDVGKALYHQTDLEACWDLHKRRRNMKTAFDQFGPVRAVVYEKTCLIIRLPTRQVPGSATTVPSTAAASRPTTAPLDFTDQPYRIVLIDIPTGRPFAWYVHGERAHEPTAKWKLPPAPTTRNSAPQQPRR